MDLLDAFEFVHYSDVHLPSNHGTLLPRSNVRSVPDALVPHSTNPKKRTTLTLN